MTNLYYIPAYISYAYRDNTEPTEEDRERWRDKADKERVYWADQYDLALDIQRGGILEWNYMQVLYLHANVKGKCEGCDFSGYDGETPEWPCRTVVVATGHTEGYYVRFK